MARIHSNNRTSTQINTNSYVYLLMGVLVGSAVFPISAVLLWRKASAAGAIAGSYIFDTCV